MSYSLHRRSLAPLKPPGSTSTIQVLEEDKIDEFTWRVKLAIPCGLPMAAFADKTYALGQIVTVRNKDLIITEVGVTLDNERLCRVAEIQGVEVKHALSIFKKTEKASTRTTPVPKALEKLQEAASPSRAIIL